tara:strand:- start:139 stop:606 length:468 start_codon:yes stop_codon:yes gene_type:complete
MTTALFIGRFQPFHNGHLAAIKQILREVDKVVIGVGSSKRSGVRGNPFTFEERFKMIEETLVKHGVSCYTIFPIPDVPNDKKWVKHVKVLVPKYDVVYSSNPLVVKLFKQKGVKVRKVKMLEGVSSTKVRKMLNSSGWEKLVPKEVVKLVKGKVK